MAGVIPMPTETARAHVELISACSGVRLMLAEATTVREAFAIWDHCKHMTTMLERLTNEAAARVDQLSEGTT